MFTTKVTYENPYGEIVTESLYFHLTKLDLIEMDIKKEGGYKAYLEELIRSEDKEEIYNNFKQLVLASYGKRLPDGRFYKDEVETKIFKSSEAFSEFMMMLSENEDLQVQFTNGIFPKFKDTKHSTNNGVIIEMPKPEEKALGMVESNTSKMYSKEEIDRLVKEEIARIKGEETTSNVPNNDTNS